MMVSFSPVLPRVRFGISPDLGLAGRAAASPLQEENSLQVRTRRLDLAALAALFSASNENACLAVVKDIAEALDWQVRADR